MYIIYYLNILIIIIYLKYIIKYYILFKLLKIRDDLLFPIGMDYNRNKNRYIYLFYGYNSK